MEKILGYKRGREEENKSNTIEKEEENQKIKKISANSSILSKSLKKYKTIQQIKDEAIKEYNSLNEEEKKDNSILIKINEKFDILEEVNYNILTNDLNEIQRNKNNIQNESNEKNKYNENIVDNKNNDNESPNNNFIEDYKKYRYTIVTNRRIDLLNKYLEINKNLDDLKIENESKDPKVILIFNFY